MDELRRENRTSILKRRNREKPRRYNKYRSRAATVGITMSMSVCVCVVLYACVCLCCLGGNEKEWPAKPASPASQPTASVAEVAGYHSFIHSFIPGTPAQS